jgi:DNA-directed RNA polymerase specialized sigma24 family protein
MSEIALPLPRLVTVEPSAQIGYLMRKLARYIECYAGRLAADHPELVDDLVEEGYIGIWEADPSRLDLSDATHRAFLLRSVRRCMWRGFRRGLKQLTPKVRLAPPPSGRASWRIADSRVGLNGVRRRTPTQE